MKATKLILLLLLSPLFLFAQGLTGLWIGVLSNDSTTIRKDQSYEIALTEYRGNVYGYSRSEFIVNDTLYYIVKRVRGTINGDVCEVKDDKIISYNFRGKLDKGVKLVNTFRLNKEDSTWQLDGEWKTNATKKYYALTGKTELKEETDIGKSKLYPHLEELRLADELVFYKKQKSLQENQDPLVTKIQQEPLNNNSAEITKIEKEAAKASADLPSLTKSPEKEQAISSSNEVNNTASTGITEHPLTETKKPVLKKEDVSAPLNKIALSDTKQEIQYIKNISSATISDLNKLAFNFMGAAALVQNRESVFAQTVYYKSDSLQLALYDNGEIDGDTVSLLLNGEIILAKQGLKATAIRKTIYPSAGNGDSLVLVLYAENLGKYPPNTGLLVVRDGEDIYNVRFSADFKNNAAIILRKKNNSP